jgi:hypothetical protein
VELIALLNGLLALAAVISSFWAVPKVGKPLNIVLVIAGCLALFYSGAYIWLLFHISEVAAWSNTLRWLGLISWPVAWIFPPLAMVRYKTVAGRGIRKASKPDNVITPIEGIDVQEILNRDDYSQ